MKEQQPLLITPPDIIVATPARALLHLQATNILLDKLQTLVVDEADLVFSFGYEEEIKEVVKFVFLNTYLKYCHCFLNQI